MRNRCLTIHAWLTTAFLLVAASSSLQADLLSDICRLCPSERMSYPTYVSTLKAMAQNPRVTVAGIGQSRGGRLLHMVTVRDPQVPVEDTVRVFIVARQHGTESSGMTAALALVRYFARAQGETDRALLRQLTIIAVPVANPDGMTSSSRGNAAGVDLNRDWSAFSQPETRALAAAIRALRPHALLDLHELPASSAKPAYRDNFIETIGRGDRLTARLVADCEAASSKLALWLGQVGISANVYYDGPEDSPRLCHRYYGLTQGIPAFLLEAKCGPGRSLLSRTRFHVLGALVVANQALHRHYQPADPVLASADASASAPAVTPLPRQTTVRLSSPTARQVARGQLPISAEVTACERFAYVQFEVDGQLRALSNCAPHVYALDTRSYADGPHRVSVLACDAIGQVLCRADSTIVIDNQVQAGE